MSRDAQDTPACAECWRRIIGDYVMLVRGRMGGIFCSERCRDIAEAAARSTRKAAP